MSAAVPSCTSVCAAQSFPDGTERGKGLSCFHAHAPPPPSNLALLFLEILLSHVSLPRHGRWPLPGSEKGRIPVCPTSDALPGPTLTPKEWEKPDWGQGSSGSGSVGCTFLQQHPEAALGRPRAGEQDPGLEGRTPGWRAGPRSRTRQPLSAKRSPAEEVNHHHFHYIASESSEQRSPFVSCPRDVHHSPWFLPRDAHAV